MSSLEEQVRGLVEMLYCCKFPKRIDVLKEGTERDGYIYTCKFYLHSQVYDPLAWVIQCSNDEEFLEFITNQLKKSKLNEIISKNVKLHPQGGFYEQDNCKLLIRDE